MNSQKLILMLENIVANLGGYSQEQQIEKATDHIQQFWTPNMREQVKQAMEDSKNTDSPLIKSIVERL